MWKKNILLSKIIRRFLQNVAFTKKKENLQQVTLVTLPQRICIYLRDFKMNFNNLFPMI